MTNNQQSEVSELATSIREFRDICLSARADLLKSGDAVAATDKVIKAQIAFENELEAIIQRAMKEARIDELKQYQANHGDEWDYYIDQRIATLENNKEKTA